MKSRIRTASFAASVGVLALWALPVMAQEEPVAIEQSPELKVLGRFVGTWEWKLTLRPAEWVPKEKTITFDMKNEWILDARMVQFEWAWAPGNETIHCMMLWGYDAEKKQYTDWYFDSTGAVPEGESRRTWDETTKTLTGWLRSPNGQTNTQAHRFIDDDTFEWNMVIKDRSGKVMADMVGTAKRKALATPSDAPSQGTQAPSPEMKPLQQMVGTWQESNVSRVAEWTPKETRGQSTLKVASILGGHFIRCEVFDDDGNVLAMMIRTFDEEQQAYREWMFPPSRFGGKSRGQWDDTTSTLTLTGERLGITTVTTVISGWERDWAAFDEELNALADKGWEVFQSSACSCGGFLGSGYPALVIVLRRPKS